MCGMGHKISGRQGCDTFRSRFPFSFQGGAMGGFCSTYDPKDAAKPEDLYAEAGAVCYWCGTCLSRSWGNYQASAANLWRSRVVPLALATTWP